MNRRTVLAVPVALGLLAAVLALSGPVAEGQVVGACSVSSTDQAVDSEEQQLLVLINQHRAQNGLPSLALNTAVTKAAAWFSRDMTTKNYFSANHVDSNGRTVAQRLTWCGVSYSNYAENIYAGRADAQNTFTAWRNSSGHNANMLRTGVTAAGIGRAYNAASTYDWYWTLDLTNTAASAPTTTRVTTTTVPPTTTTTRVTTTTTTRPVVTTVTPTTTPTSPTTSTTRPRFVCPPEYAALCGGFG